MLLRLFIAFTAFSLGYTQAFACISLTRTERNFEILGQANGGYQIRITTQEFDRNSGEPMGPQTTNEIVEDDFYLLSHMVTDVAAKGTDTSQQHAMLMVMEGYGNYIESSILPYIRDQQSRLGASVITNQEIQAIEVRRNQIRMLASELREKQQSGNLSASELSDIANRYKEHLREISREFWAAGELRHRYASTNGGETVDLNTYSPPKTRSVGCTSGLEVGALGFDRLAQGGTIPADALSGQTFSSGSNEN